MLLTLSSTGTVFGGMGGRLGVGTLAGFVLPLLVFLPKLIQQAMKADTDAVIDAFGKNEQVKKVFWTLFVAMAGCIGTGCGPGDLSADWLDDSGKFRPLR